jgi:hypothetical protein
LRRSALLTLPALLLLAGCGGYASTSEAFRHSLTDGRPQQALERVDQALGVSKPEDLPSKPGSDTPLLLLERGTILQAMQRYDLSARDFQTADANLEVLDYTNDTAGSIGKYLFSDDAKQYKAPPYEKLLLNTLNMVNYLARGDLGGAKVEARRLLINQKFLRDAEGERRSMLALGSYLAGFAFEMDHDYGEAMRHYGDAYDAGGLPTLIDAARRVAQKTGDCDPRLKEAVGDAGQPAADDDQKGDLLIVVQTGMAPYRVPERLPIGAAVVAATSPGPGAHLSADEQRQANVFAAKGILKWVNYPRLQRVGSSKRSVEAAVDHEAMAGGEALDIEERVVGYFKDIEGGIIAASIVRLIARAAAGELSQTAAKKAGGGGLGSLLIGLAVEGAMTAADTPDTRSWVTLPARIFVARRRLPAGEHDVEVRLGGAVRSAKVNVPAGGFAVLNFSDLR